LGKPSWIASNFLSRNPQDHVAEALARAPLRAQPVDHRPAFRRARWLRCQLLNGGSQRLIILFQKGLPMRLSLKQ
jgi:hypothetical protein